MSEPYNFVGAVREFHEKFGHPIAQAPTLVDADLSELRVSLLIEEVDEYGAAIEAGDLTEIADALGDIIVVAIGAALVHGVPIESVVDAIMEANMSKLGEDGKPIYREDGKILKGPNYAPPTERIAAALEIANVMGTRELEESMRGDAAYVTGLNS